MTTVDTSANKENKSDNNTESEATKPIETNAPETKQEEQPSKPNSEPTDPSPTDNDPPPPTEQNEEEILAEGLKLINAKDYATASSVLSDALQVLQQKDISTTLGAAKYYMAYGESLFRLVQSQNDLFAAPSAPKSDPPPNASSGNGKEENEEESKAENGAVDTSEDREIAWETFEYARSIIEEYLAQTEHENDEKYIKMLATVHSFLGEICIEDENNSAALMEFEKALALQQKCKNETIECREKTFNRFYACLAAQFCEKDAVALEHCNAAMVELSQGIRQKLALLNASPDGAGDAVEELKENVVNEALVCFVRDAIKDKEGEIVKDLEELIGFMTDLTSKCEELKQQIEWKKQHPTPAANDGQTALDLLASGGGGGADPLQALISGLTSRFGIDEAELAKMSAMDADVNGNSNKKRDASEGVTTIGFGNGNGKVEEDEDDDDVHELGSFGSKQKEKRNEEEKVEKDVTKSRKRSFNEAGIGTDDGTEEVKKMKLNSGDSSAVVDNEMKEIQK